MILLLWIFNHSKIIFWGLFIASWVTSILSGEEDSEIYCTLTSIVFLLFSFLGDYSSLLAFYLPSHLPLIIINIFYIKERGSSHQRVPYTTGNPKKKNKKVKREEEELKPLSIISNPPQASSNNKETKEYLPISKIKINIKEKGEG